MAHSVRIRCCARNTGFAVSFKVQNRSSIACCKSAAVKPRLLYFVQNGHREVLHGDIAFAVRADQKLVSLRSIVAGPCTFPDLFRWAYKRPVKGRHPINLQRIAMGQSHFLVCCGEIWPVNQLNSRRHFETSRPPTTTKRIG